MMWNHDERSHLMASMGCEDSATHLCVACAFASNPKHYIERCQLSTCQTKAAIPIVFFAVASRSESIHNVLR